MLKKELSERSERSVSEQSERYPLSERSERYPFKYNPNVSYKSNIKYSIKDGALSLNLVNQIIFVNRKESFKTAFPDLFQKYQNPPLHSNEPWNTWIHSSFNWWQCQLNFATWCASTGCGVSFNDHINPDNEDSLTKSIYMFHLYYCIARILKELKVPLPTDSSFCYYKNTYDKAAYRKICDEFHVSPYTDWRQKLESSCHGLGKYSQYFKPSGEYRYKHSRDGPFFNIADSINHTKNISLAWTTFILDKSEGFTKVGIERINESIRTYVWALLGSQSQTRSEIIKIGTGFDAQKQFLVNIQDVINSPIDLPTQISNYQNVLKYARSKVDYVYGLGLYMSPSDMVLQIGTIVGYNNTIVIATENQRLGFNSEINIKHVALIQPETTKKSIPEHKEEEVHKEVFKEKDKHEDTKIKIIVGSIVIGIVSLFIYEIY
jgi:hypothetical protein